jgi:hypothetical protein
MYIPVRSEFFLGCGGQVQPDYKAMSQNIVMDKDVYILELWGGRDYIYLPPIQGHVVSRDR